MTIDPASGLQSLRDVLRKLLDRVQMAYQDRPCTHIVAEPTPDLRHHHVTCRRSFLATVDPTRSGAGHCVCRWVHGGKHSTSFYLCDGRQHAACPADIFPVDRGNSFGMDLVQHFARYADTLRVNAYHQRGYWLGNSASLVALPLTTPPDLTTRN